MYVPTTRTIESASEAPEGRKTDDKGTLNQDAPKWRDAVILAAIFAILVAGLESYGLYEPHETHFAGVAREMIARGDYITPHLNGAPYLNKPPLLYWMVAVSYSVFGINEWAARLPLAVVGWLGVLISWQWARQLWGLAAGRTAAAMLTACLGWYVFSHQLISDLLLSVLHLLAAYLAWNAIQKPDSLIRWSAFYVSVGLGVLSKGPISLVFAVLLMLGYVTYRREWKLVRKCRPIIGTLIVGAIVAPWLIQMELRNPGYLHYAIVNENLKRAIDTRWPPDYDAVKVSVPMFLLISAIWMAPWSLLIPQVASFAYNNLRLPARQESSRAIGDGILLLSIAALIPVVFFLMIPSRLIYYSLPAVPTFCILTAGWWSAASDDRYASGRRSAATSLALLGAAVFSATLWMPPLLQNIPDLAPVPEIIRHARKIALIIGLGLLTGGILLGLRHSAWSILAMSLILLTACGLNLRGFSAFDAVRSSKRMVKELEKKAGIDCVWISECSNEIGASAGIAWYLGHDSSGQPRTVRVMGDDPSRPPPSFPGARPGYLINHARLEEIWASDTPTLFITDFQRTDWEHDKARLPQTERFFVKVPGSGHRHIYANKAAWHRLGEPANAETSK
jgi:hypothetical protein